MMHHELADAMFREVFAKHSSGTPIVRMNAAEFLDQHTVAVWVVPCSCGAVNTIPEGWSAEETQEEHMINVLTRMFSHRTEAEEPKPPRRIINPDVDNEFDV